MYDLYIYDLLEPFFGGMIEAYYIGYKMGGWDFDFDLILLVLLLLGYYYFEKLFGEL
jgi:hypothetical protein